MAKGIYCRIGAVTVPVGGVVVDEGCGRNGASDSKAFW
jgi:hypothetical protein